MKTLLHVSIFIILLTCSAFSNENSVKYSIALVGMSMDYREFDSAKTLLDSETSTLGTISGYDMSLGYLFNRTHKNVDELSLNAMFLDGRSHYVGQSLSNPQGYGSIVSTTQNRFIDTTLAYKHTQRYNDFFDLFYALGFGYHAWQRDLSSIQGELYEWYPLRPKVGVDFFFHKFSLGAYGEYQYGINTQMSSSNPSAKFKLGGADIIELGFPVRYNFRQNLEFFTQYTLSTQTIKASNTVNGLYEPDSTSHQNSLKIGATFKF